MKYDVIIIGGGAAGFFTAINCAELNPELKILILEQSSKVLQKVRISGGGRCNVTHAEFIPNELVKNYPRGQKELKGPFHHFMTGDVMEWFEDRGVPLKIEEDGRVFPVSNSSESIINCFLQQVEKYKIQVKTKQAVKHFEYEGDIWQVDSKTDQFQADKLVVATGSQSQMWEHFKTLGVQVIPAVPSLFTFNCKSDSIKDLPGVVVNASVSIRSTKLKSEGPVLITHWGFSGPAILKLSAWGARVLEQLDYKYTLVINWAKNYSQEEILDQLEEYRSLKSLVSNTTCFQLPKRLWKRLVEVSLGENQKRWCDLNKKDWNSLSKNITQSEYQIEGKSTFKDEFVTAGGIDLKEINFKTYESKKYPNCYIVGECLNIDAITGGFNFQNAWTGGFLAARSIAD